MRFHLIIYTVVVYYSICIRIAIAVYHNVCYGAISMFPFSAYFSSFALTFFHAQTQSICKSESNKRVISNTCNSITTTTTNQRKTNEKKKKNET